MNSLRPYQSDLVARVRQAYRDGYKRPCIVAPCGAGKSVIAAEMAKRTTTAGHFVLYLVHRQELCEQIVSTFRSWGVDMMRCKVGMVQSIVRLLEKLPKPDLIITDENHHCLARSYQKIYEHWPDVRCVGVTATPVRLNGGGLGDVNDVLIETVTARQLIDAQFLAPYEYYAPPVADLSGLKTSRGEYVASDVTDQLDKAVVYGDVIGYYRKLSAGKQAICYCASISHSERMAERFNAAGITAAHIDGKTDKCKRKRLVDQFRCGALQVLCNVDLISEGFDVPDCNTAILLRPTQSLTLYIQQSMRCMRYKPGKTAVIIDHVGNYLRHGLPDQDRDWTLDPAKPSKRKKQQNSVPVQQCPMCFYTHLPAPVCPHCGYEYPKQERTLEEIKEARLEKISSIVLDYSNAADCHSLAELQAFARRKGYKPGWAWYQAKQRGII